MNMLRRPLASPWVLLAVTAGFVALADFLVFDHMVGWALGLFLASLASVLALRHAVRGHRGSAAVALALTWCAAGAIAYQPGVTAVLLALAGLVVVPLAARRGLLRPATTWFQEALLFALTGWLRNFADMGRLIRWRWRRPSGLLSGLRLVFRWLLPFALTCIFIWLFSLANPLIERWCDALLDRLQDLLEHVLLPSPLQFIFWCFTGFIVWLLLRMRPAKPRYVWVPDAVPAACVEGWPSTGLVIRCLALFNLAFLLQNGTDAFYLWGGAKLPEGMTYAGYAHRGAYPLVATALLAAAFVLVAFRPGGAAQRSAAARRLVHAWIAQNVALTLSAAWRLHIYIDAYSLTRLRLASVLWMLLVAFGLVTICARLLLRRSNGWLLDVNTVALLLVFLGVSWTNVDGFIAMHNARHCREAGGTAGPFDTHYVVSLGPEALPALRYLKQHAPGLDLVLWHATLREDLLVRTTDWRGWSWRRAALLREFAGQEMP